MSFTVTQPKEGVEEPEVPVVEVSEEETEHVMLPPLFQIQNLERRNLTSTLPRITDRTMYLFYPPRGIIQDIFMEAEDTLMATKNLIADGPKKWNEVHLSSEDDSGLCPEDSTDAPKSSDARTSVHSDCKTPCAGIDVSRCSLRASHEGMLFDESIPHRNLLVEGNNQSLGMDFTKQLTLSQSVRSTNIKMNNSLPPLHVGEITSSPTPTAAKFMIKSMPAFIQLNKK